jgi:predicted RNA binding protein YcfA (HicA-like mRNA interferase family)
MPPKVKELIRRLKKAGFAERPGKGSHRVFAKGRVSAVISGGEGKDAHPYQIRQVKDAIAEGEKNEEI